MMFIFIQLNPVFCRYRHCTGDTDVCNTATLLDTDVARHRRGARFFTAAYLIHNTAGMVQNQPRSTKKEQRLEKRNEHELQTSNERLLHDDVQHRGHSLARYRDLRAVQAVPSQVYHYHPAGNNSSAGGPAPTGGLLALSLPSGSSLSTAGSFNSDSSTAPPRTWVEADLLGLAVQGAIHAHAEELVLEQSTQSSTGFEGVYAYPGFEGGYGAELQKCTKRLRQGGFCSPIEAALERARWTKSLTKDKGHKGHAPSAGVGFGQQEQLAAEALADLMTVERATVEHQQLVPVGEAALPMHEERRWLSRPLHNLTDSKGRLSSDGAFRASVDAEFHPANRFQATLKRAGHTLEGRGTTTPSTKNDWDDGQQVRVTPRCGSPHASGSWHTRRADPAGVAYPKRDPKNASDQEMGSSTLSTLEKKFNAHVMCNYAPRAPGELPMKYWVSCEQLLCQLQPHAAEAEKLQPDYIKQLITNRFKDHPAFAGHSFSAWCKTLKDHDAPPGPGKKSVMKFSFEYTQSMHTKRELGSLLEQATGGTAGKSCVVT